MSMLLMMAFCVFLVTYGNVQLHSVRQHDLSLVVALVLPSAIVMIIYS